MNSIRRRTLLLVLGLLGLTLSLISYWSYTDARHEVEEVFDAELLQTARLVAGLVGRDMPSAERQALQATLDEVAVHEKEARRLLAASEAPRPVRGAAPA